MIFENIFVPLAPEEQDCVQQSCQARSTSEKTFTQDFPQHQRGLVSLKLIQFGSFRLLCFAITCPEVTQSTKTQPAHLIWAPVKKALAPDYKAAGSDSEETKSATLHASRRALPSHVLLDFMTLVVKMQPLNYSCARAFTREAASSPLRRAAVFSRREI